MDHMINLSMISDYTHKKTVMILISCFEFMGHHKLLKFSWWNVY